MKNNKPTWNTEELKAYLFLFFNNTDCKNQREGILLESLNLSQLEFNTIQKEFEYDNDYQSIQKISTLIQSELYSKDQVNNLFHEVKDIFIEPRKKLNFLTNNMFVNLERVINAA